jgi:hypothetical protein
VPNLGARLLLVFVLIFVLVLVLVLPIALAIALAQRLVEHAARRGNHPTRRFAESGLGRSGRRRDDRRLDHSQQSACRQ